MLRENHNNKKSMSVNYTTLRSAVSCSTLYSRMELYIWSGATAAWQASAVLNSSKAPYTLSVKLS